MTVYRTIAGEERWKSLAFPMPTYLNPLVPLPPYVLLRRKRLGLLINLFKRLHWPAILLLLAGRKANHSWIPTIESDFEWVAARSNYVPDMRGAVQSEWIDRIIHDLSLIHL